MTAAIKMKGVENAVVDGPRRKATSNGRGQGNDSRRARWDQAIGVFDDLIFCCISVLSLWGVGRVGIDLAAHIPVNNFARAKALRTRFHAQLYRTRPKRSLFPQI